MTETDPVLGVLVLVLAWAPLATAFGVAVGLLHKQLDESGGPISDVCSLDSSSRRLDRVVDVDD